MSVRKKIVDTNGEPVTWWLADYRDGSGKRHQVRFKRKAEAEAHEEKSKVQIRTGNYVALENLTVAEAANKWLSRVEANGMRHRGPVEFATLRQYKQHVNLHIVPRIGALKLTKLTKETIEDFRNGLLGTDKDGNPIKDAKALSRPLARKVLVSLKSILKANKCGHVADDVSIGIDKRSKPKLVVGKDIPTTEEIKRLIDAAAPRPKLNALVRVAAMCGLRASELRALRWFDVDLKANELHVRQKADRRNTIGSPKSSDSGRTVPLSPETALALKKWRLACPKGEHDLVFPTSTGKVEHHKNMLRSLVPVSKEAKVMKGKNPKYKLHALRHFFASWLINPTERGGRQLPAIVAKELLGHSSITITMDIYGHLFPKGTDSGELAASEKKLLA
jgi:integrase